LSRKREERGLSLLLTFALPALWVENTGIGTGTRK
jgi:hypothetical protein